MPGSALGAEDEALSPSWRPCSPGRVWGRGTRRAWPGAAASTAAGREAKFVQTLEGARAAAHAGGTCVPQQ